MLRSALRSLSLSTTVAFASVSAAQTVADDPRRPPPLEAPPECQLYRGSARGNDPTQLVELVLCVSGSTVRGTFQTSSLNSGWSKRSFVGSVVEPGARLSLRETAFLENRSNPGWRFCLIDRYDVRFSTPTHIESSYRSNACNDDGHISVDLVVGADAGIANASELEAPRREQPRVVIAPPDLSSVHTRSRGIFGRLSCAASPARPMSNAGVGALLIVVSLAGFSRRARARASMSRL